ncbi:DUF3429 domain-containing protein [Rhizobium sp. YIM 134829]|uniref:DUF3429 domain-containing protein n=1 Tax=Rhizobium sp. YIM 134829 TaxID=3390453 RepID=UPI00397B2A69
MDRSKRLTQTLTLLGALPFLALAIGHSAGLELRLFADLPPGSLAHAFLAYGAVIGSFMAGTIWMQAEIHGLKVALLLLLSNAVALVLFATLIVPLPLLLALLLQAGAFILLLGCDSVAYRAGRQKAWYFRLRCLVTVIVLCAYALMIIAR